MVSPIEKLTQTLFDPRGTWNAPASRLYDALVARGQEPMYQRLLEEVPRILKGELLDVGCGPGHAALLLARARPGVRVTGVDSSAEMIRLATEHARQEGVLNARFLEGDALALPLPDRAFDGAFSFASLKHWPDRARGLRELARVLKPGAEVVLIEADRQAPSSSLDEWAGNWPWLPAPALRLAFRTFIAKDSIDAHLARELLEGSPLAACSVERLAGTPLLALRGCARTTSV